MIQVDSMAEIADSVRKARKEQGVSQTVLAQLSNHHFLALLCTNFW